PKPWEFRSKPAWQRLIVMLGGIAVNVMVGILIFIGLTYFLGDIYLSKDDINRAGKVEIGAMAEKLGIQDGDKIVKINREDFFDYLDILRPENLIASNASFTVDRCGQMVNIPLPDDFIEGFKKDSDFIRFRLPAEVGEISPGSIAEKVGLQYGDKVIEVQGRKIEYWDDVTKAIKESESNTVNFAVMRDGQVLSFRSDDFIEGFKKDSDFIRFRLPAEVGEISPGSIAEKVGLQYGDKVIEVQGRKIEYWDDVTKAIKESESNTVNFAVMRDGQVLSF